MFALSQENWASAFFEFFGWGLTLALLPLMHPEIGAKFLRYVAGASLAMIILSALLQDRPACPQKHNLVLETSQFWLVALVAIADLFILLKAGFLDARNHLRLIIIPLLFCGAAGFWFPRFLHGFPAGSTPISLISMLILLASGGALMGSGLTTMLLGHSYLVHANLSFEHLVRVTRVFIACVMARFALSIASLILLIGVNGVWGRLMRLMDSDPLVGITPFVRVLVGLVFPLILGVMAYKCAKIRANQSATGIMYVATGFVIIGELCSFFLMFRTPFPL